MARSRHNLVYVGIKHFVLALDRRSGAEVWRAALPARYKSTAMLVNVVRDADGIIATCAGEVFALDPRDGRLLWHEPLKGLGTGLVTVATDAGGATSVAAIEAAHQATQQASRSAM